MQVTIVKGMGHMRFGIWGLRCVIVVAGLAGAGIAHTPHDISWVVAVSPDYREDETVFGAFTLSTVKAFGRTVDGGRIWSTYATSMAFHDIRSIAFSPDFADDGVAFIGTNAGGVYRTIDGGSTWQPVNVGLDGVRVRGLAVSPDFDVEPIVLAATDAGCYSSMDAGGVWAPSNIGLLDLDVTALAWVEGTQIVYAGGSLLSRSENSGRTWQLVHSFAAEAASLSVSPADASGDTLAVSHGEAGGGVMVSTDGGQTFAPSVDGLTDLAINEVSFTSTGVMFAAASDAGCFRAEGPFLPWTVSTEGLEKPAEQADDHYFGVASSPSFSRDQTVFLAAWEGTFKSTDGGQTWEQLEVYSQRINRLAAFSPSYAQDGTFFVGNYGGAVLAWAPEHTASGDATTGAVVALKNIGATGGASGGGGGMPPVGGSAWSALGLLSEWDARATGIIAPYPDALVVSPGYAKDGTLYVGFAGIYRSRDSGLHWEAMPQPGGLGLDQYITRAMALSPDFLDDATVFVASGGTGTFRSTDGCESWTELVDGLPATLASRAVACSPAFAVDRTVMYGSLDRVGPGVFRSVDGGDTWSSAGLSGKGCEALAFSPDYINDRTILAATVAEGLAITTDDARQWVPVAAGLPTVDPLIVDDIAFSPDFAVDRTVFVSVNSHGVYRSVDGGFTWAPANQGLPLDASRRIAISPEFAHDRTLIHTTHDWVWRSTDAGDSWQRLPGLVRADDLHQSVRFTGEWNVEVVQLGAPPKSFAAGTHVTDVAGAETELTFFGDSIAWYSVEGPAAGIVRVFIDDIEVGQVDLYAASTAYQRMVFLKPFDDLGWHTIRVRTAATKNPASSGHEVHTDGFLYTF